VKEVGSGALERELRQQLIDAARRREINVTFRQACMTRG